MSGERNIAMGSYYQPLPKRAERPFFLAGFRAFTPD